MTNEVFSIFDLRDLAEPEAIGFFPVNGVMTVLLILGGIALFFMAVMRVLRWRKNAYRRVALKLLDSADSSEAVNHLLKRVALAAWPREEVASLYGAEWNQFLRENCNRVEFSEDHSLVELKMQAGDWIRFHRRPAC